MEVVATRELIWRAQMFGACEEGLPKVGEVPDFDQLLWLHKEEVLTSSELEKLSVPVWALSGFGDDFGDGFGSGFGDGYSNNYGFGDYLNDRSGSGDGFGDGYSDGYGDRYGDGYGDRYGDGYGNGSYYGSGYGLKLKGWEIKEAKGE